MKKILISIAIFVMMAVLCLISAGAEITKEPYMYYNSTPLYLSDDELYSYTITSDNTVSIQRYHGDETEVVFPDTIDGMVVTGINGHAEAAYANGICPLITTKITIPSTVTYIQVSSFQACPVLKEIVVDEDNTSYYSYDGCLYKTDTGTLIRVPCAKTAITLSPTIKNINLTTDDHGYDSFDGCSALTSVSVATSNENFTCVDGIIYSKDKTELMYVPNGANTLSMPKETYRIGLGVEYNGLSYINVEDGNEQYSSYNDALYTADKKTFLACPGKKTSLIIAPETESIAEEALRSNKLESVVLGEGLTSIDYRLFYYCSSLSEIVIPNSITTIGQDAFYMCTSLTNMVIPDSVTAIEFGAFRWCSSLSDVTIPYTVTSMSTMVFEGCSDNLIINCYEGSVAHQYAIGNDIEYNIIGIMPPSNVSDFKIADTRTSNALRLNWTANNTADGYIIEQYKDGKWVRIKKITSNATTTYRVTGLAAGTAYKFRMRAYKMDGTKALYSGYTSTLSARTNPSKVAGLKIGGYASNALRLNWTKNTSADGYIIEQYKDGKWVRIKKITSNATTTYRIAGLKASTEYKFRVKAYKMSGKTALYSGYTSTLSAYTNPSAVSNLKITGKAGTALRLGWSKNTSADGYIIEMYSGGKWIRVAKITSNATVTYRKSGLAKGTTYKFRVRTYNMVGKTALYGGYVNVSGTTNK